MRERPACPPLLRKPDRLLHHVHHADDDGNLLAIVVGQRAVDRFEAAGTLGGEKQRARATPAYPARHDGAVIGVELVAILTLGRLPHRLAGTVAADDLDDLLAQQTKLEIAVRQHVREEQVGDDRPMAEDVKLPAPGYLAII